MEHDKVEENTNEKLSVKPIYTEGRKEDKNSVLDSISSDNSSGSRNEQKYQYAVRRFHRKCEDEIKDACPKERGWTFEGYHRGDFKEEHYYRRRRDFKPTSGSPIGDSEPEYISDGLSEEEKEYFGDNYHNEY